MTDGQTSGPVEDGLSPHAPTGITDQAKLRLRVLTSIVAVAFILAGVFLGDVGMTLGLLGAGWFAARELFALFEAKGYHPARNLGVASCLAIMVLSEVSGTRFHGSFLTAIFVLCFVFLIVRGAPWFPYWNLLERFNPNIGTSKLSGPQMASISDVATTFLGILYTGWLPSFIILLRKFDDQPIYAASWPPGLTYHYPDGLWITLLFFLAVVATDVGAYFSGKFLGRTPLIGPLSPRKTLAGAVGGLSSSVVVCTLFGAVGNWIALSAGHQSLLQPWWQPAVFSLLVSVTAQVSDLSESMIKRDVGRRDAGELIPGHGGMLDRVDSYLLSGAVAYWYVLYFWKVF